VVRERPRRATVGRGGRARRGDDVEGRRARERDCKREGGAEEEKREEVRGVWGREGGAEEEVAADGSNPIGEGGERLGSEREVGSINMGVVVGTYNAMCGCDSSLVVLCSCHHYMMGFQPTHHTTAVLCWY